jgi:hypothetical protein
MKSTKKINNKIILPAKERLPDNQRLFCQFERETLLCTTRQITPVKPSTTG